MKSQHIALFAIIAILLIFLVRRESYKKKIKVHNPFRGGFNKTVKKKLKF